MYNNDQYFTDFVADEAEKIIVNHDKQKPLFLELAHLAVHASENVNPIEVRNMTEVNATLGYIRDINRRRFAGSTTFSISIYNRGHKPMFIKPLYHRNGHSLR